MNRIPKSKAIAVRFGNGSKIRLRLRRDLVSVRLQKARLQKAQNKITLEYLKDIYEGRVKPVDALNTLSGRDFSMPRPSLVKLIVDLTERKITVGQAWLRFPDVLA